MSRAGRRLRLAIAVCAVILLVPVARAAAQWPRFTPDSPMLAGSEVFTEKGCDGCHRIRGMGSGTAGLDLARVRGGTGFFGLAAAMWNHLPEMGLKSRELGIARPSFTPLELSNLLAFLFTAQYYDGTGDPAAGAGLFAGKGCVQCHAVGGTGARIGPALDNLKRTNSPVLLVAAMWNHGPQMAETMKTMGIARPTFRDMEFTDLVAYIFAAARDQGGEAPRAVAGTPERGARVFGERGCARCHPVATRGGLGTRARPVSLTQFAGLMWNHGPVMWAAMRERGTSVPRLTGQEMADVIAYLFTVHYFDPPQGSVRRGRQLVSQKGCLRCHSINNKGGKTAPDFATSNVVGSAAGQVAAMWNHGRYMETEARRQSIGLTTLTAEELADIATYLAGQGSGPPKRP